jgi:molecular chaperone GrpE
MTAGEQVVSPEQEVQPEGAQAQEAAEDEILVPTDLGDEPAPAAGEVVAPDSAQPEDSAALSAALHAREAEVTSLQALLVAREEELKDLRGKLGQAQEEARQNHGRLLRTAADLDNFRKRAQREKAEQDKYGHERLVKDLLAVVDNLERALAHSRKADTVDPKILLEGVEMVLRQSLQQLAKHGVQPFESLLQKFDPLMHEALQQVPSTEHETGTVVQEFQRGYHLHDRLLRPALVVVAQHVGKPAPQAEEAELVEVAPVAADEAGEPAAKDEPAAESSEAQG